MLTEEEIEGMRVACRLAREVLEEGVAASEVGVTTDEVDRIVHEAAVDRECYPSPLNYHGFPKSCCTSVNEVSNHGSQLTPYCKTGRDFDFSFISRRLGTFLFIIAVTKYFLIDF